MSFVIEYDSMNRLVCLLDQTKWSSLVSMLERLGVGEQKKETVVRMAEYLIGFDNSVMH